MMLEEKRIKISVVMPIYNACKYLRDSICSVQKQTMQELELLCVDDGSTDDSYKILQELQKTDERIRIFRQKNQGAGIARNLALKCALGHFVCFLDADDYWIDREALEKLYKAAIEKKVNICGGQFYIDRDGEINAVNIYGKCNLDLQRGKLISYSDYQYDYHYQNYIYERKFLLEQQILFPNYNRVEDMIFFVRAMSEAKVFYIVNVPFYCYRIELKKINYDEKKMSDFMQGIQDNLQFSAQKGLKKLHMLTYHRMFETCNRQFQAFILQENPILVQKLNEINMFVKWEWLEEKCEITRKRLKSLADMQKAIKSQFLDSNRNETEKWLLPSEYLNKNSKIALYGAGDVGSSYFRQIKKNENYFLCAWADKNYQKILITDYNLISPEQLLNIDFDILLIGVAEIEMAMDIMDDLTELGIPAQKLVWDIGR